MSDNKTCVIAIFCSSCEAKETLFFNFATFNFVKTLASSSSSHHYAALSALQTAHSITIFSNVVTFSSPVISFLILSQF